MAEECGCNTGIAEGACDCDGNVDLGCGCNLPASISYCIDTDSDSLGTGDSTYYCLADLPTGWVEDCSDLEPDCDTNDTDECGICGGDNSTCTGCMDDTACNYNIDAIVEGVCEYPQENYDCDGNCILEIDCEDVCGGSAVVDGCGECGGNGIVEGACDCDGNVLDECGVCGGDGAEEGFGCDGEPFSLFNGLIPEDFSIHSIYPNPFNPITNITYGIPEYTNVQILVYDLSGKQVETLINEFQTPGYHSVNWNADNLPSGVYLIRMDSGDFTQTQKVVLVK